MSTPSQTVQSDSGSAPGVSVSLTIFGSEITKPATRMPLKLLVGSTNLPRLTPCLVYLLALVVAVYGNNIIAGASSPENLAAGAPWLGIAFTLWLAGGLSAYAKSLLVWWHVLGRAEQRLWLARLFPFGCWLATLVAVIMSMWAESALAALRTACSLAVAGALAWLMIAFISRRSQSHSSNIIAVAAPLIPRLGRSSAFALLLKRAPLFVMASLSSALVWQNSSDNLLPQPYFELWLGSAVLWSLAFAPIGWSLFNWATGKIDMARRFSWREHGWVVFAFLGIMILGAAFRLVDLDALPRDMFNHDQETEIRVAYGFSQGEYRIAAFTYQAQQTLHGYFLALFSSLPGFGFDFMSLKLFTVITSLFTLPLVFWVSVEVIGRSQRQRGIVLGLITMGLVAVSYWYVAIVRTGLRNHLTTIIAALAFIFLARAMRQNRRADFIKLGLTLGIGMYAHNACMIVPLAVVMGIVMALVCRRICAREAIRYLVNLAVCGFVAIMIYLPMYHVALEYPDLYYRVSLENMFDYEAGVPIEFDLDVFLTGLMANFRDTLLMFHWKGDHVSFWSAPFKPALDIYSGAGLSLGLAVWFLCSLRRPRDPVWLLLPVMALVMLLPSTLAVMRPENNPNFMRTLGAIPALYLLAALPIGHIAFCLAKTFPKRLGRVLALLFCSSILLLANQHNSEVYFDAYADNYDSAPYGHVGNTIRSLTASGTPLSNVVVIGYPHFWHAHNVFIEAGAPEFVNVTSISHLRTYIENARQRKDEFRLNPMRDLVFLHAPKDELTAQTLHRLFPQGRSMLIRSYLPEGHLRGSYTLFRAPAMGDEGLDALRDMPRS